MDEIPIALRNGLESGNCVLFVGAGVGHHCRTASGESLPMAKELAALLNAEFNLGVPDILDLTKIARLVEIREGRKELVTALAARMADVVPDEVLRWLFTLTWKAIFTTNYDNAIEKSYELNPSPTQTPVSICRSSDFRDFDPRFEVPIYHLHGCLSPGGSSALLITDEDYATFRAERQMMFARLQDLYSTTPILYVGYGNEDPNWKVVTAELRSEFAPSVPPISFRVAPGTPPVDREILEHEGVMTLDGTLEEFASVVQRDLGEIRVDPASLDQIETAIPADLRAPFRQAPAAVARLTRSWTYVNQAPFHEDPNVKAFLAGDHPNWALISRGVQFERDVEEGVVESLLDFATTDDPPVQVSVVIGPAGYGISTVLMATAFLVADEGAGAVYMHRRGRPLTVGDIESAAGLLSGPTFFFIDNAADHAEAIRAGIARVQQIGQRAYFLLGERLNEWRQLRGRIRAREFGVEPLSDPEIERLLDYLGENRALKKLKDLDREQQLNIIRNKHKQELLVAMKEATEGQGFNAIIEDEYRNLENETSRLLYAAASCFYRFRALARDQVLANMLGMNLAELHRETSAATEGVVIFDSLDDELGIWGGRARHHKIAEIVWERALEPGEKERLTQRALDSLNLNFHSDAQAFEQFVRFDAVDEIRDLDGKMRFFEAAINKDPRSEYVRQHYARMLRREGHLDAALKQIDAAIDMAPGTRVLYHTKGLILTDLSAAIESDEIARRRLAQAESVYRKSISMQDRDEYGYHGLAMLYFTWAKRVRDGEERAEYLARSEEVIAEGLRQSRQRESLYVASAEVHQYLGDDPSALQALEKAVEAHPESGIARFLLARYRLRKGESEEAMELIKGTLEREPEDVRAAVLFAQATEASGATRAPAIAVLEQANLYGARDPRYVATLGGMLFMEGRFTEAAAVFKDALDRGFNFDELRRIEFVPKDASDPSEPVRLEGRVTQVRAGFAFVEASGYPAFFCHSTKYGNVLMRPGKRLSFQPAFCPRGAVALEPREL